MEVTEYDEVIVLVGNDQKTIMNIIVLNPTDGLIITSKTDNAPKFD